MPAIREVQPGGPYHLGGWSLGGVVAYLAALELRAAGEEVPVLALFDSPAPPEGGAPPSDYDDGELLRVFARFLGARCGKELPRPDAVAGPHPDGLDPPHQPGGELGPPGGPHRPDRAIVGRGLYRRDPGCRDVLEGGSSGGLPLGGGRGARQRGEKQKQSGGRRAHRGVPPNARTSAASAILA